MGISTLPAVLDKLVELARLTVDSAEQVIEGPPVRDIPGDVILLAFTGEPGEEAVTDTRTREQLSIDPDRERYEITCLASSWKGREPNIKAVRDTVYGLVDAFNTEIMRDHTLNRLVLSTRLATVGYTPLQTTDGASATVRFVIAISAFTR